MTKPDPLSLVGEVLDGTYRIDSLVGEGGFGVVYRAMRLGFDEPVAVKCLKIPGALSSQTRKAFLRKFREETGFTSFTPQYAAPEQFDPRVGPTGPWTDVYSFALVIVEMLTDRLPVQGDDAISLMKSTLDPQVRPTPPHHTS